MPSPAADEEDAKPATGPDDERTSVDPGTEAAIRQALATDSRSEVETAVQDVHYSDIADVVERLDAGHRLELVQALDEETRAAVLTEIDEVVREDLLDEFEVEEIAAVVQELETDDAVDLVETLEDDDQQQVLEAIPEGDRTLIEEALSFPEDSAGRLMQREVVAVPSFWTVGETIDFLRAAADQDDAGGLPNQFYDIVVIDPTRRPVGSVPLSRLLRTRRPMELAGIMETELRVIPAAMDQEEVAFLFRQRDLVSAPVVDDANRLVGVITIDDVVDVIHEEHEEDLMALGGVATDDLYEAAIDTTKQRFRWLLANLATAVAASLVISLFEATLEQIVALAVLMPIVASMGGNAGTQTLTVAVRALATRELSTTNAGRVIGKEVIVGVANGLSFAVITGGVAWVWFGDPELGLVIGLAMIVNMIVAGLAGATIPLMLERYGVDPAVASSVFLTTVTDVVGFFAFLGLAALILL